MKTHNLTKRHTETNMNGYMHRSFECGALFQIHSLDVGLGET